MKRFGGLTAVNNVSLEVVEGEILGLIGPNGAGKTTLLNCVAGSDRPTAGRVRLLGSDTTGNPADEMCRRGLGRTFQIPQPFPKLTALENVTVAAAFGRPRSQVGDPVRLAEEMLDYVEFAQPKNTPAERLNTVQLKRLDLARALASKPKVLLLDEMAAGLTPAELRELMPLIRTISHEGIALIVVEHVMMMILELCTRLIVLHYGEKIAEGSTEQVAGDPRVAEAYLGTKILG
jgi:branched-chain amino acid transport system ATP-binding protein